MDQMLFQIRSVLELVSGEKSKLVWFPSLWIKMRTLWDRNVLPLLRAHWSLQLSTKVCVCFDLSSCRGQIALSKLSGFRNWSWDCERSAGEAQTRIPLDFFEKKTKVDCRSGIRAHVQLRITSSDPNMTGRWALLLLLMSFVAAASCAKRQPSERSVFDA